MILDGCHFQYGDFDSREYGVIFAHCNTERYLRLMGEVKPIFFFNKRSKTNDIISDDFSDSPISFDAEIVSDNFEAFPAPVRRMVEKSLFNKPNYRKLYVDIDDDCEGNTFELVDGQLKRLYFKCRFVNPVKIEDGNGIVVGYGFSVECDSPMAWQDEVVKKYTLTDSNTIITVNADTDIGGYTYPDVTIHIGSTGGDLTIINTTDNSSRFTKFNNLSANITLTMKGNINYVSGQNYEKFENQNFIRLLDGANRISIVGDVSSIEFKWNNRRFL